CIRTYSIENGLDQIPAIAQRHGLKVLLGLWLSSKPEKNRHQVETAIRLAKTFPATIRAVIVGNEVLLRGELSVADLTAFIREVKSKVSMPVTYADVWEYWLRYPDLQSAVDFVTIHILPYWEDFPLPAPAAAAHVEAIRKKVAAAIPNKEVFIGEIGWPSAGRMREGALPSLSNQARVVSETLALAQRENFRVNVIEAFNQPWKRWLEGATGGYWGIFDRATGKPKFSFSGSVSNHPHWRGQALAGILLAGVIFGSAFATNLSKLAGSLLWPRIALFSSLPAVLFGWTLERIPIDSFSAGTWLRALAFAAVAAFAPIVCAVAYAAGRRQPTFAAILSHEDAAGDPIAFALGACLIALTLLSIETALGLVFDPRYRDLPFAPQSGAVFGFLLLSLLSPRPAGARAAAERLAAAVLAASAVYIALDETFANWQAVWLCAGLIGLAVILARARDVQD
ncbi:MAG TPA: beta-(1-6) glucans synthase, partial [Xanthobacteraceae bacterium]|nr:beta-(1-6) glucans synthase [Xanthobacteraceae bacterium]